MNSSWRHIAEEVVHRTLNSLPATLQSHARAIPVVYESCPTRAMAAENVAPDSMGLFVGATYAEQQDGLNEMPSEILLFIDNIRAESQSDPEEFRNQVRTTYLHELGHYLGLNEGEISDRDLA